MHNFAINFETEEPAVKAWEEGLIRAMSSLEEDYGKEIPAKFKMAGPKNAKAGGLARRLATWACIRSRKKGASYTLMVRAGHTRRVVPEKLDLIYEVAK